MSAECVQQSVLVAARVSTRGGDPPRPVDRTMRYVDPVLGVSAPQALAVRMLCVLRPIVVELGGQIDIANAPCLRGLLRLPVGDVVVDLTEVTFMACAGLTLLLDLRAHLDTTDSALRLVGIPLAIQRLIALAELQELLPC